MPNLHRYSGDSLSVLYRDILYRIFNTTKEIMCIFHQIDDMDVDDGYFKPDGATCHTAGETMALYCGKNFPNV